MMNRRGPVELQDARVKLTVLISAYNEVENPFFWKTLETIKHLATQGHHIRAIVGVTHGSDETIKRLDELNVTYIEVQSSKRSVRYNEAFKSVTCKKDEWILLHHPRSIIEPEAFLSLEKLPLTQNWGAFTHRFDLKHPLLSFTSWWSNCIRGDLKKIFYLDHCLFVRSGAFEEVGGFPEREIFEDTVLSKNLSRLYNPVRLPWKSTTSAVRFKTNGIWNQSLKNQILKLRFFLNANDEEMNQEYEKGIDLNTEGQA